MTDDTDTTEIVNDDEAHRAASIDAAERAAMRGHREVRDELATLGWSEGDIEDLEDAAHGYEDFARCVADERRWARTRSDD